MKRTELVVAVKNTFDRCRMKVQEDDEQVILPVGVPGSMSDNSITVAVKNNVWSDEALQWAIRLASAMAFTCALTEDDDTRRLRWQYGDLIWKGHFTLED